MKPTIEEHGTYFGKYVGLAPEHDLMDAFANGTRSGIEFWQSISEEQSNYRYAPEKWSIKELLQHIIDTERIFSYRALCFARGEKISLPSYDENTYAANSHADDRSYKSLLDEYELVRKSSIALFNSFSPDALTAIGHVNNSAVSVRSAGFIIVGHEIHHMNVVKERYLATS